MRPRSWRDTPQRPKSDKFCRFHSDYGHTTEECRHLKNEIERLIQNGYLQEYVYWERARGTGPYQKKEGDKAREEDLPEETLISSDGQKDQGPQTIHNDALVITAMIANYEVGHIFIDSGISIDILVGEAYDQMQLGDISLEKVNTSLYGFSGEVVNPQGMVRFPLKMGRGTTRKTCLLKFLAVDVPSAYHVILGQKRNVDDAPDQVPPSKKGKAYERENSEETETPAKVQPAEELLNIEIIPENPDKTTRIGSHLGEEAKKEITLCLQRNAHIFAWTPQDQEGIDPRVITHHLNIDPSYKPVKQKKRHFGPEKDKIIQAEVNKLIVAGHIKEIKFPEWLSNVVLVPKPEENGECASIFET
ncbi:UNVERIFIED_CONTAM: hypothetical protein Sradi_7137600 [Sesamum radiatum]|uniref:Reverse transcriptase domain-containing protein n=1 Tax=Sesamum radiatum TaxID=300843 RepID=A0AAW2IXM4_SESRA